MTQPQPITPPKEPTPDDEELREMMLQLYRAFRVFTTYVEKKYPSVRSNDRDRKAA